MSLSGASIGRGGEFAKLGEKLGALGKRVKVNLVHAAHASAVVEVRALRHQEHFFPSVREERARARGVARRRVLGRHREAHLVFGQQVAHAHEVEVARHEHERSRPRVLAQRR